MPELLLVYASTHGHTGKIAERLAAAARGEGAEVDVYEASEAPPAAGYAAVIAGGSLHEERHQKQLVEWVKANLESLRELPTAFFSVSLTAAEDSEESREATGHCIEAFVEETGWSPGRTERIAGALQYLEYDRFTRAVIRLMMKRGGHPTDTSRDYDYTDWEAVDRLGRELAGLPAGAGAGA